MKRYLENRYRNTYPQSNGHIVPVRNLRSHIIFLTYSPDGFILVLQSIRGSLLPTKFKLSLAFKLFLSVLSEI